MEAMMLVLFSHNQQRDHRKDAFAEAFPDVYEYIYALKRWRHSQCAILLQWYEAAIITRFVSSRLIDFGIPFLTIHDSVIVRTEDAVAAEDAMRIELARTVGTAPSLHIMRLPDE